MQTNLGGAPLSDRRHAGRGGRTLRSQLNLAAGEGLVVTDTIADGPAAKAGIKRHDVLTKLDNKRLSTVENVNAQIQEIKDRAVSVIFLRGGQEQSCEVAPQLSSEAPARSAFDEVNVLHSWIRAPESRQNLRRYLSGQEFLVTPHEGVRWHAKEGLNNSEQKRSPRGPAAEIAELKKQLARMQKTLESLESALPSAQDKPQQPDKD